MRSRPLRLVGLLLAALPASSMAQPQVVEYYHLDALGTVRAVTNETGVVLETHNYLPFGEELCPSGGTYVVCGTSPAGQPKRFTGKERDTETGLDYFGARYYRANVGRFTTIDPVYTWEENLVDPQRWNRYSYVRNNPLKYVDPDGRVLLPALLVAWGAVELGLQLYDSYSTVQTLTDPKASFRDKAISGGGFLLGAIAPGGGYGAAGKAAAGKLDDAARIVLKDGDSLPTNQALDAALEHLGSGYREIAPGVFKSADGNRLVRMTDSDLAKAGNHAGAPHMNFETGRTVTKPNGKETFLSSENKHIFLPQEVK